MKIGIRRNITAFPPRSGLGGGVGGGDPVILLDASDNSTVLNSSDEPAAEDEDVHTWVNKGSWAPDGDAIRSTEIIDPILKLGIVNQKDVLRFIVDNDETGLSHSLPAGKRFDLQNHTMICVFKLNEPLGTGELPRIFEQSDGSGGENGIRLLIRESDSTIFYQVEDSGGTVASIQDSFFPEVGVPYVLAVRCVDGQMSLWRDGVQLGTASHAFTGESGTNGGINVRRNSTLTYSGRMDSDHGEIRMYDKGLTDNQLASEISNVRSKWKPEADIPEALDISGLALWLDGSDESTLYDAEEAGSNVAADGAIARWEDKSGNFRHATQATSAARPIRKAAEQNGRDVVRFDGIDDILNNLLTFDIHNASMFVVCRLRDAAGDKSVIRTVAPGDVDNRWYVQSHQTRKGAGQLTHSDDTNWKLIGLLGSSTQHISRHNGVEQTESDTSEATTESTYIGGGNTTSVSNDVTVFGEVDIAEVVVYTRTLTTPEREQVEEYLQNKWATPALP